MAQIGSCCAKAWFCLQKLFLEKIPHYSLPCVRGEQVHSWQSHGVALTTCELGNAPLFGAFPDRGGVSLAPPRRWLAEGKTEGLLSHLLILGVLSRGEKALSWQSPGGALTTCELGNGALCAPFQGSRADAKQMRGKRSSGHRSKAARNAAACKICSAATRARALPRETVARCPTFMLATRRRE